tara:strand:- start:643 stop:921 length:279 start_codon:yes stop_codon:yes gene_type:complete
MAVVDDQIRRKADRIAKHIRSHFRGEFDRPHRDHGIHNSVFWPGSCGVRSFCGDKFSDIGFNPDPQATIGEVIDQVLAFAESRSVLSGPEAT